jgi:peroxiredoxin Q/BCP
VSPDSIETHKKFAAEYGITFPLISDENNAIRKLYASGRITYLIDKQGVIRYIQEGVPMLTAPELRLPVDILS